jgi:hypothetical protein
LFHEREPVKAAVLSIVAILLAVGSGTAASAPPSSDLNLVIQDSCVTCHNETTLLGNLSLEGFDVAKAAGWSSTTSSRRTPSTSSR